MPVPSKIERLVEGASDRTMFSAQVVNELIDAINALLAMEGKGGIVIKKSDSKFTVWSNPSGSNGTGGGGGTTNQYTSSTYYTCLNRYA